MSRRPSACIVTDPADVRTARRATGPPGWLVWVSPARPRGYASAVRSDPSEARVVRLDPSRPLAAQAAVGHNRWHPGLAPVLTVEPGETFTLETLDSSDAHLGAASSPADVMAFPVDRVHPLTGPVAIAGARPGMVLAVEIVDLVPRGPAISSLAPREGVLGHLIDAPVMDVWRLGDDGYARTPSLPGVRVPVRPFPGTIGVAPSPAEVAAWRPIQAAPDAPAAATPARAAGGLRTLPPWPTGGNIDVPALGRGSTLFLRVSVDDALLSVGDLHVAQGAGELGSTAIETAGAVTLRCALQPAATADSCPYAVVPARPRGPAISTIGLPHDGSGSLVAGDLRLAARNAAVALVRLVAAQYALPIPAAVTLVSVAADLEIAQLVNDPFPTVTCSLSTDVFETTRDRDGASPS
jgi:formamidase